MVQEAGEGLVGVDVVSDCVERFAVVGGVAEGGVRDVRRKKKRESGGRTAPWPPRSDLLRADRETWSVPKSHLVANSPSRDWGR